MRIELSPQEVAIIIGEADAAARRLRRRLALPVYEREDLCQELLIDLLRRLPNHDPARGSLGAFAGLVLRNASARTAKRIIRRRRAEGGALHSIDVACGADDPRPLSEVIAEDQGLSAWHGQAPWGQDLIELREALRRTLARLSAEDRLFCSALACRPLSTQVSEGLGSRSTLYRRLEDLRHVLTAFGLGPSWDELRAA